MFDETAVFLANFVRKHKTVDKQTSNVSQQLKMALKLIVIAGVMLDQKTPSVVVAPPPRISWSSHLLTPQKCQSRFSLLDYLCCFYKAFSTDL